jgi:hypothetical protein
LWSGRFHSLRGYFVVAGASDLESGACGALIFYLIDNLFFILNKKHRNELNTTFLKMSFLKFKGGKCRLMILVAKCGLQNSPFRH